MLASELVSKSIIQRIEKRSKDIMDNDFIIKSWIDFCKSKSALYLPHLFGLSTIINKIYRLFGNRIIKYFYTKKQKMIAGNIIRCESHNEVINTILNKK